MVSYTDFTQAVNSANGKNNEPSVPYQSSQIILVSHVIFLLLFPYSQQFILSAVFPAKVDMKLSGGKCPLSCYLLSPSGATFLFYFIYFLHFVAT